MGKKSGTEILEGVAAAINGEMAPFPTRWPHRYGTFAPARGAKVLVALGDDETVTVVPPEEISDLVVSWMRLQNNPDWFLTTRRAAEAVDMFRAISTPIPADEIKPVRWLTERGYTWRRLPWDPRVGGTPTWDRLMSRLSNATAFRAFIGSLMFPEARQHQYLWIYGMGQDGKGAINRFIKKLFGHTYRSKQPPAPGDKFWLYGLLGARVVTFPDCNAKAFVASGLFKTLTGGDPVDVEAKGRMSFTAELMCRFVFLSNQRPTLSSQKADMRRIVYCEFEDEAQEEPGFEENLWEEGGSFLTKCVHDYARLCPDHLAIPSSGEEINDWVSVVEEEFDAFFDANFVQPQQTAYRTSRGVQGLTLEQLDLVTVAPDYLQNLLTNQTKWDRARQSEFRDWMKKKYSVDKRSIRPASVTTAVAGEIVQKESTPIKRYVGLARRLMRVPAMATTVDTLRY